MSKGPYALTPRETELLQLGKEDPDILTGYWFRRPGRELGFQFDYNFEPEGQWQKKVHSASQSLVVVIGGVGTGKTLGIGMSAVVWCLTARDFKFLNVAQKAWQAHIMYRNIMEWAAGAPIERLIEKAVERPYPKIVFAYQIGGQIFRSSMEFMSVADDAMGIFSWRGDKVCIEEAGHIDNLQEVTMNLSTRLTGSTPSGRPYFGQLILISNPWDNPHLWELFDLARDDPENNLSLALSTRHNKNVTDKQIQNLLKHIPEDERARFLDGTRPEGRANYFSKEKVFACEDREAAEKIEQYANQGAWGYKLIRDRRAGVVEFATPPEPGATYIILGDPGVDNAPNRNSPVIGVWKVPEDFPLHPMELVAFWWGSGNRQIMPFVTKLLAWCGIENPHKETFREEIEELTKSEPVYNPVFVGIDSTGTQKNFAELLNLEILDKDLSESEKIAALGARIVGLDFSGAKKATYLLSLRLFIENRLMRWPKCASGIRQQLLNYDPALDRGPYPKRAQDVVAMMAMSAFATRTLYDVPDTALVPKTLPPPVTAQPQTGRNRRLPASLRYRNRKRPLPQEPQSLPPPQEPLVIPWSIR